MTFDEERYAREVLEPARSSDNRPPADLLVRYALTTPLDPAQVAATLPAVLGCWRRARRELKYRKLVTRLEADHARLAPAFDKARAGDVRPLAAAVEAARSADHATLRRVAAELRDIAGPVGRITPELAADLAGNHGLPAEQLAPLFEEAWIQVVAADPLPAEPPVSGYPRYREALRTLGCRHTADFVLDEVGEGPGGELTVWDTVAVLGAPQRRVVASTVHAADLAWAARPHDGTRTLASTVLVGLKALVEARGPAGVAELVRYEVAEELHTRHRQGASAAGLVDYAATSLGLAADDARRIVFAVRAEAAAPNAAATDPTPGVERPAAETTPASQATSPPRPVAASSSGAPLSASPPAPHPAPGPISADPPQPAAPDPRPAAAPEPASPRPAVAPEPDPRPAGAAPPDGSTPPAAAEAVPLPPIAAYAPLPAPRHVAADRAGDEVVVRWEWPPELTEVCLRWQLRPSGGEHPWRQTSVSRGAYRSQGGAWLPIGDVASDGVRNAPLHIELVPVAPRHGRRAEGAPVAVTVPGRVEAWYEVARSGPPWRRELTIAVRADQRARLRRLSVVLRRGRVMPLHATDGELLRQVEDVRVGPDQPVRLTLPAPHGPYWLRCFAGDDGVELRDPPVTQLRSR